MNTQPAEELLQKRWLHSHEEDTPTEMVYRPADYAFPPARGRSGFDLKPDGQLIEVGIAPTDGSREVGGTWHLQEGENPILTLMPATSGPRTLQIASVSKDRLTVRK
jgi:hypothetical protein